MHGRTRSYDFRLAARDRKLQALRNLAHVRRDPMEITRLQHQIKRLGQTLG